MKLKRVIENFFLFALILLNILDFLEILEGDFDIVKKLVSWSLMIYLLYHFGFTRILVGYKKKIIDSLLVIAYSLFVVKDLIFIFLHTEGLTYFEAVSTSLRIFQDSITYWSFNTAALLLIFVAFIISRNEFLVEEKNLLGR
ncbi:hypothetical protein GOV05_03660 [Candidatus Woesearchaeota archaeon]|nr:hypothetical protein [Candidatus Woesearchaeota archaeon]